VNALGDIKIHITAPCPIRNCFLKFSFRFVEENVRANRVAQIYVLIGNTVKYFYCKCSEGLDYPTSIQGCEDSKGIGRITSVRDSVTRFIKSKSFLIQKNCTWSQ
jgi:hypothetical protein